MVCSVIGLGYIGLPTAAIIASKGITTIGVDTNSDIVNNVNNHKAHFYEKDLDKLLKNAVKKKKLVAKTSSEKSDVFIITVPTPIFKKNKEPNLKYVFNAIYSIAPLLKKGNLIIKLSLSFPEFNIKEITLVENKIIGSREKYRCAILVD